VCRLNRAPIRLTVRFPPTLGVAAYKGRVQRRRMGGAPAMPFSQRVMARLAAPQSQDIAARETIS
jgi:hypothetical protein